MMRKLLALVALWLIVGGIGSAIPALSEYSNVTSMYINTTAGAQTDYQIKFVFSNSSGVSNYYTPDNVIYTNGTTRPDWYDINVTDGADTPLSFWVENNTATAYNATVWVKIPTISVDNSSVLKWRYGYSTQTESTQNGLNTFVYFDDFIVDTLNTTQNVVGAVTGGSVAISNGVLTVDGGTGAREQVRSLAKFGAGYGFRSRAYVSSESSGTLWNHGFGSSADTNSSTFHQTTGNKVYFASSLSVARTTDFLSYRVGGIDRYNAYTSNFTINDGVPVTITTGSIGVDQNATAAAQVSNLFVDWMLVRKEAYPEPITSLYVTTTQEIPPIASFTCTPTSTTLGTPIACTDTSSDTPTNWTYYWGDGNVTDGTQNPSYTYPFTGTFSINQTVNNTLGSSWYNRSNYITITNITFFTQQDIYLTGQYLITFNVKSSTTNLPIANVTVVDSVSGQSYPSTNGTAFLTLPAGLYYINFIADGYQSKQVTYVVDQDETHEVKMVPVNPNTPSPPSIVYIPQQVRFQLVGTDGNFLSGVFIQATPINFTAPSNWTETLLGISPSVGIRDTTVYGTTGTDGSWVAPMLQSFQYQVNMTRGADVNYNFTIYPTSLDYKFTIPVAGWLPIVTPSNIVSYSLQNTTINESSTVMYQFINMTYNDGSLNTDKLSFVVYDVNNTMVYSQNYTGAAANAQNFSYIQQCNKGQAYTYGFQANQSAYGWINQSSTIKLTSQIELLANGPAWIGQWIAIVLIVVFGTLFMIYSKPFALIGIPLLTWSFQYVFKLIPGSFLSLIGLGCMLTIGVLVYIRQAENKIQ